jgi:chemotaxis protein CheC
MVGQQVLLTVPSVDVVDRKSAIASLREREGGKLVAVKQDFSGPFSGRALLIFPHAQGVKLVRLVTPEDSALDDDAETLSEIGNIVINGCLGELANVLKVSLGLTLPELIEGSSSQLFKSWGSKTGLVLFIHVNFSLKESGIRGYIALLMDLPEIDSLRGAVGKFIEETMSDF